MTNKRFVNLDGSIPQQFSSIFRWSVLDRLNGRRRKSPPTAAVPQVPVNLENIANAPQKGEPIRLTWIGHASWLVQLDGHSLLIDPVFSESLGPGLKRNAPAALQSQHLPKITAQLISHSHRDHLDLPSVSQIRAPVVAGLNMGRYFKEKSHQCVELDWWSSYCVDSVSIHFVPAQHWSQRGITDRNETLWGGFVIKGSSGTIYHSGDTAYFDGFKEIGCKYGPIDAALLPIGAYDPEWFMTKQHMNPEQATQAFEDLGAKTFVAMHWGTFKLTDEPLDEPPVRLISSWKSKGFSPERCKIPAVGETLTICR